MFHFLNKKFQCGGIFSLNSNCWGVHPKMYIGEIRKIDLPSLQEFTYSIRPFKKEFKNKFVRLSLDQISGQYHINCRAIGELVGLTNVIRGDGSAVRT